ncbi:uncharacterized protein LOC108587121 [Papio anubis]|uniref:uncharacterized protein LOC108587121 n=1 Tax=Papio anubis TaxID=9555 RepID=UPI00027F403A|nr:uncharacterized protein LOC108587121 [Papio anubis]
MRAVAHGSPIHSHQDVGPVPTLGPRTTPERLEKHLGSQGTGPGILLVSSHGKILDLTMTRAAKLGLYLSELTESSASTTRGFYCLSQLQQHNMRQGPRAAELHTVFRRGRKLLLCGVGRHFRALQAPCRPLLTVRGLHLPYPLSRPISYAWLWFPERSRLYWLPCVLTLWWVCKWQSPGKETGEHGHRSSGGHGGFWLPSRSTCFISGGHQDCITRTMTTVRALLQLKT